MRVPDWIAPQLATLVSTVPRGEQWLHETKYDGYRILIRKEGSLVKLYSRNGLDWTATLPELVSSVKRLPSHSLYLDGELTVVARDGRTSFQLLQRALSRGDDREMTTFVFDILHRNRKNLQPLPLLERKSHLSEIVERSECANLFIGDFHVGDGASLKQIACRLALEGIVSKNSTAPYRSGRSREWVKCKCLGREEFVVIGFTRHSGDRGAIGALLLGSPEPGNKRFRYRGRVGTGFSDASRHELYLSLSRLAVARRRMTEGLIVGEVPESSAVVYVKPHLVAEVSYSEKTSLGHLRHPVFLGLRADKRAQDVVVEGVE